VHHDQVLDQDAFFGHVGDDDVTVSSDVSGTELAHSPHLEVLVGREVDKVFEHFDFVGLAFFAIEFPQNRARFSVAGPHRFKGPSF